MLGTWKMICFDPFSCKTYGLTKGETMYTGLLQWKYWLIPVLPSDLVLPVCSMPYIGRQRQADEIPITLHLKLCHAAQETARGHMQICS